MTMRSETLPLAPAVAEDRPQRPRRYRAPILQDARLWLGVALLVVILAIVFPGDRIAPYDPHALSGRPMERPSGAHLLGTNDIGQDLFSQVMRGGRVSLVVGF
ncbi:MAG: ABC transporter permease, partial [Chloroflexota bacterium]|nr:ABC transporter permease [Chloroflexota bacterium]